MTFVAALQSAARKCVAAELGGARNGQNVADVLVVSGGIAGETPNWVKEPRIPAGGGESCMFSMLKKDKTLGRCGRLSSHRSAPPESKRR